MRGPRALAISFIVVFLLLRPVPSGAQGSPTFALSPNLVNTQPGGQFTLSVEVMSGGANVFFGQFNISLVATAVTYLSVSPSANWKVNSSASDPTAFTYSQSGTGCGGSCPDSFTLATLTFLAASSLIGNTTVSLSGVTANGATGGPLGAVLSRTGYFAVITSSAPPAFGITPPSVTLQPSVRFNATVGIVSNSGPAVQSGIFNVSFDTSVVRPVGYSGAPGWTVSKVTNTSYTFSREPSTLAPPATGPVAVLTFVPATSRNVTSSIPLTTVEAKDASGRELNPTVSPDESRVALTMTVFVTVPPPVFAVPWNYLVPVVVVAVIPPIIYLWRRPRRKEQQKPRPDFTTEILRRDDLLALTIDFYNFKLQKAVPPAKLVRIKPGALMVVSFQGQNVNERAFYEQAKNIQNPQLTPETPAPPPVPAVIAGPSRLVFKIPDSVLEIPFTLESLLAWTSYEMNVVGVALPASVLQYTGLLVPKIRGPEPTETSIEAPYRLIVSPSRLGGWAHSILPVLHDGWTELWHTRLGVRKLTQAGTLVDELDDSERAIRAVWSPDYSTGAPPNPNSLGPFRSSLSPNDRHQVVRLTSDFGINYVSPQVHLAPPKASGGPKRVPQQSQVQPIRQSPQATSLRSSSVILAPQAPAPGPAAAPVKRFMLSTLGAWMDVRGAWVPPPGLTVHGWVHQGTQGRDHYVRVVYGGYLFPFGHRASLIKVTERKFVPSTFVGGVSSVGFPTFVAYLRQHTYIVVQEHEKAYSGSGRNNQGRDWPFTKVNLTTQVTPDVDDPAGNGATITVNNQQQNLGTEAFWPRVGGADFQFHAVAEGIDGNKIEFGTPLMFVMEDQVAKDEVMAGLRDYYHSQGGGRTSDFSGQKVTFAESAKPGDTAFETRQVLFGAEVPSLAPPAGSPHFYPTLDEASVNVTALSTMLGNDNPMRINYDDTYLSEGLGTSNNQGEVFAKLALGAQLAVNFPSDKVGGLINPNMNIVGLSRSLGPIGGDLASLKSGNFDPSSFFKDALSQAKILGISLIDVIAKALMDQAPKFVTEVINDVRQVQQQQVQVPKQVRATLDWVPKMQDDPTGVFVAQIVKDKGQPPQTEVATMKVTAAIVKNLDGSPPTVDVHGELKNFEVHLIHPVADFIVIKFSKITFDAHTGKKLLFDTDIYDIKFAGPLEFVETLQQYIPLSGFDPPSLQVTPQGVKAGFDLALPSIGFGVFSLQNISLGASLNLPFTGDPVRVRFNFCERQNPFLLTVSLFGGGGFFAISLGPDTVEILEAALEFGGNVSIDIGVASGGVYIMAGVYFKLETVAKGENCELTGYLRCGGSLEVLCLVTISAQFYMGLSYDTNPKRVWGQATLTVEVSVAFFSQSVSLTVQREFANSPPPTFESLVPQLQDWSDYCEAFD